MKKEWFVLQTLTGQENKVQTSIKARTVQEEMGEYVGQCVIPMEKVTETKDGIGHLLDLPVVDVDRDLAAEDVHFNLELALVGIYH